MSVKTNENVTIAELREESRSTLLLEPNTKAFCPTGYVLHQSHYKCVQCPSGTRQHESDCRPCLISYYQTKTGQSACVKCPNGQTTKKEGSTSVEDCFYKI